MIRATSTRIQEATAEAVNQEILRRDRAAARLLRRPQGRDQPAAVGTGPRVGHGALDGHDGLQLQPAGIDPGSVSRPSLVPGSVGRLGLPAANALRGWCPPVPVLRRFGVRTGREIEQERYALKILRGDFQISDMEGKSDLDRVASILRLLPDGPLEISKWKTAPSGNRTRVAGVKSRCPRPLDDRGNCLPQQHLQQSFPSLHFWPRRPLRRLLG